MTLPPPYQNLGSPLRISFASPVLDENRPFSSQTQKSSIWSSSPIPKSMSPQPTRSPPVRTPIRSNGNAAAGFYSPKSLPGRPGKTTFADPLMRWLFTSRRRRQNWKTRLRLMSSLVGFHDGRRHAWVKWSIQAHDMVLMRISLSRMQANSLFAAVFRWASRCEQLERLRIRIKYMWGVRAGRAFALWALSKPKVQTDEAWRVKVVRRIRSRKLLRGFCTWIDSIESLRRERSMASFGVSAWRCNDKFNALSKWRDRARGQRFNLRASKGIERVARLMRHSVHSRAWRSWLRYRKDKVVAAAAVRVALGRWGSHSLLVAWAAWIEHTDRLKSAAMQIREPCLRSRAPNAWTLSVQDAGPHRMLKAGEVPSWLRRVRLAFDRWLCEVHRSAPGAQIEGAYWTKAIEHLMTETERIEWPRVWKSFAGWTQDVSDLPLLHAPASSCHSTLQH